jgi:hypothetical protein
MQDVGVSVQPLFQPVDILGPQATSPSYKFRLESKGAIVGTYQLKLSLFSKDDELVSELSRDFVVTA